MQNQSPIPPRNSLRRNSIYLLPNSFTIAALFCAFFAITQSMHGRYETAAIAVFLSMLLDSMDGRVARLTNSQSAFGEQVLRSEERRVGKECRSRWSPYH